MNARPGVWIAAIGVSVFALLAFTQLTLFVVPPIGVVPEGRTLVITRLTNGKFIDSADAMCVRIQGHVNLLCRAMTMGAVADNAIILVRLPYSRTLDRISTGGIEYGNPPQTE